MLILPQAILRDCYGVFRRALTKSSAARSLASIRLASGRDGTRLWLMQPDIGIEYHHPTPTKAMSMTLPLNALAECEGNGKGTVQLQVLSNGHVEVRWDHASIPQVRDFPQRESPTTPFPAWPKRDSANNPSLLKALDDAMQIPTGDSGRLALTCIQLRGDKGDVVATDGRQLLIQGGFQFPWREALLLPRTPVFAARELPQGDVVRVAKTPKEVLFRIGSWTIALRIDSTARFPNVDAVIPKPDQITTRWTLPDEEVSAFVKLLDDLPGAKEDGAPVTLDLAKRVAIRARAEEEERCTEVVLANSSVQGRPVRIATDRRFLQRALKLGFRTFQISAAGKPVLCQDMERIFVWVPLHPDSVLAPQRQAAHLPLPALAQKQCQDRRCTTPQASCIQGDPRCAANESRARIRRLSQLCARLVVVGAQASSPRTREIAQRFNCGFHGTGSARRLACRAFHFLPGRRIDHVQHLGLDCVGVSGRQRQCDQQQRGRPRPVSGNPPHRGRRLPRSRRGDAGRVGGAGADELRLDGVACHGSGGRRLLAGRSGDG